MFKRQFYALEHSNRGDSASSSSSSSLATASDGEGGPDVEDDAAWPASSHESDTSSEDEVVEAKDAPSAERALVPSDDESEDIAEGSDGEVDGDIIDVELRERKRKLSNQWAEAVDDDETERVLDKFEGSSVICVGSSKKVYKCRLCPKVVCLSEESMQAHLASKGHARSLKHLAAGKLKVQLDSEGEEEEEGETHAERYTRTLATAQEEKSEEKSAKRKPSSGRQRQRKRLKKQALLATKKGKTQTEGFPNRSAAGESKESQALSNTDRKQIEDKTLQKQKKTSLNGAPTTKLKKSGPAQMQASKKDKKIIPSKIRIQGLKQRGLMPTAVSS